jgi:site-specific DNA-methyltransferase (adenine-specific)
MSEATCNCGKCGREFTAPVRGGHRLLCGDSRDFGAIDRLFGKTRANVAITSPPYASQRKYDESSGFTPIPPEEYVQWFRDVAANILAVLAEDGSYFLNIKEHAEDGQRSLYVRDLTIAHVREWGWRFVDEFCWRKTDNGVPGGWNNRFKNAWEPVFHFCRQAQIKFRPYEVGHPSADCFEYSPSNPKSTSGSGLLGSGKRGGAAADGVESQRGTLRWRGSDEDGRHTGLARPSNVIDVKTESSQGNHSAPYPVALVDFFIKAFTDAGDVVFDPFMGSGTTLITAEKNGRIGYGAEISPGYCDVIIARWQKFAGKQATLAGDGRSFAELKASRLEETQNV